MIFLVLPFILLTNFIPHAIAQEEVLSNIKVSDFVIALGVQNLTPKGISEAFPSSVQKLYAFCKIKGSLDNINIIHVWYYGEKLMAMVRLPIKSLSWRTYSSKKILPEWTGPWRVDITTEDGLLLNTVRFIIKKNI